MSTLRERAQEWLDSYKAGENIYELTDEDEATIISEYLHNSKAEALGARCAELEKRVQELEFQLDAVGKRAIRLEGENAALRFSVRCNGVSGAEV